MKNRQTEKRENRFSLDAEKIVFTAPASWEELSQDELRYVLGLIVSMPSVRIKTSMLLRFCGIHVSKKMGWNSFLCYCLEGRRKVFFKLTSQRVAEMIEQFDYVDRPEDYAVRLDDAAGLKPVNALLHGLRFDAYLAAEKYYQGFLRTRNYMLLDRLGELLYRDTEGQIVHGVTFSDAERINHFMWYGYVKRIFAKHFPHFLRPAVQDGGGATETDIVRQMDIQIRALTDGDITKEKEILSIDCWRALTELDAKAADAERLKNIK